jgi:hypothetical protein
MTYGNMEVLSTRPQIEPGAVIAVSCNYTCRGHGKVMS